MFNLAARGPLIVHFRMKIALVRRGYSASGGAERYLLRLADALRVAGHEPVLFTSPEWPASAWQGEIVRIEATGPRGFANALRESRPRDRCDFVYSLERVWECDAYRAGDGVHRAWLERRRRFEPKWRDWFRRIQLKHHEILDLEAAVLGGSGARVIIANSHMVKREIVQYLRTPEDRIRVVYNGLPAPVRPVVSRPNVRAQLGLSEGERAVLFAGSGWERKGLRFAIEAIERVKNAVLLVAGAGKRRNLPPSQRTRFLGEVKEMPDLMEAADVFLLPTIYDPFSNASLEAFAAGLPVITTTANGFSEIMRPATDGEILSKPDDIGAIAYAIDRWTTPEAAKFRHDRRTFASCFTMEENVRATLAALTRR
jgi:UDP-glucose:(heptosyl)LPS alpha-1,3-glucosyltransferase